MQLKFTARTTGRFQRKLDMAMASARKGAQVACEQGARTIRDEVAEFLERVYSTETEEKTLMAGWIAQGVGSAHGQFGRVGTAEGGRMTDFTPLHRIIRECRVDTISETVAGGQVAAGRGLMLGGNYVSAQACNVNEINERAKFKYDRSKQKGLEANPFHGRYIQSVIEGGVWNVVPRADNPRGVLHPQPGVLAGEMIKQVNPTHAFETTIRKCRSKVVMEMAFTIKGYIATASGAPSTANIFVETVRAAQEKAYGSGDITRT